MSVIRAITTLMASDLVIALAGVAVGSDVALAARRRLAELPEPRRRLGRVKAYCAAPDGA